MTEHLQPKPREKIQFWEGVRLVIDQFTAQNPETPMVGDERMRFSLIGIGRFGFCIVIMWRGKLLQGN